MEFFTGSLHWYWWSLAILLAFMQLAIDDLFIISIAGAAAMMGLLLKLDQVWQWNLSLNMPIQFLLFSGFSIVAIALSRIYMRNQETTDRPYLNRRGSKYIGHTVTLCEAIVDGTGKVKLDGVLWKVQGDDAPKGTKVKLVEQEGIVFRVEAV